MLNVPRRGLWDALLTVFYPRSPQVVAAVIAEATVTILKGPVDVHCPHVLPDVTSHVSCLIPERLHHARFTGFAVANEEDGQILLGHARLESSRAGTSWLLFRPAQPLPFAARSGRGNPCTQAP